MPKPALKKLGLSPEQLLRHWLFVTEYQWRVYCENDDSAMAISVLDVRGLTLTDVVLGGLVGFLKNTVSIANHHYPERAYKIIVVNASSFFSTIYDHTNGIDLIHFGEGSKVAQGELVNNLELGGPGGAHLWGKGEERGGGRLPAW